MTLCVPFLCDAYRNIRVRDKSTVPIQPLQGCIQRRSPIEARHRMIPPLAADQTLSSSNTADLPRTAPSATCNTSLHGTRDYSKCAARLAEGEAIFSQNQDRLRGL